MSQSDNEGKSSIAIPDASDEIKEENVNIIDSLLQKTIKYPKEIYRYGQVYPESFTLCLAILGIILLTWLADEERGGLDPKVITLSEMEDYEEMAVRVEVSVDDAFQLNSGPWIVDITDNSINGTRILFANNLNFIPKTGDILEVTGEVSRYDGEMEIISQASEVKILSKWGHNEISISDIANDPDYYEGKTVIVKSYVKSSPSTSYNTTSFSVGDTYENLRIETENSDSLPVLINGDYVLIEGTLRFDTYWFSYEIVLEDSTHKVEMLT